MNLMLLPIVVMFFFSIPEFLFPNEKRLHNQLYNLAFITVAFIVSIKYYYGPDIAFYVLFYEKVGTPSFVMQNSGRIEGGIELGFALYASILKWLGFSYWLFTVSITAIYFYAIYLCFRHLKAYKVFALLVLVVFEANILFFEFRQALSVSFYLFSVLAYLNKKYISYLLFAIIAVFFHKSGAFAGLLTFVIFFVPPIRFDRRQYVAVLILLIVGIFLSLGELAVAVAPLLPAASSVVNSIVHHFDVEKPFQFILFVYALSIYSLYYYGSPLTEKLNKRYLLLMLTFFVFVAFFYKYWFFLGRFRSYFIPLAIVLVINTMVVEYKKPIIYKQLLIFFVFVFCFIYARGLYLSNKNSDTKILTATTVFSRINESEKTIRKRNMKKADDYFKNEYLKNQLKKK